MSTIRNTPFSVSELVEIEEARIRSELAIPPRNDPRVVEWIEIEFGHTSSFHILERGLASCFNPFHYFGNTEEERELVEYLRGWRKIAYIYPNGDVMFIDMQRMDYLVNPEIARLLLQIQNPPSPFSATGELKFDHNAN